MGINLDRFEVGLNLKNRVENSDNTHKNHEACGKKIHDELQGVLEMKGPDHGLDPEQEKKEGKEGKEKKIKSDRMLK